MKDRTASELCDKVVASVVFALGRREWRMDISVVASDDGEKPKSLNTVIHFGPAGPDFEIVRIDLSAIRNRSAREEFRRKLDAHFLPFFEVCRSFVVRDKGDSGFAIVAFDLIREWRRSERMRPRLRVVGSAEHDQPEASAEVRRY